MRSFAVMLMALAASVGSVAGAVSADAASAVRLAKIQYDSPGSDGGSNTSLNAEWVTITNHASSKRALTGWTLRDGQQHVYRFPAFSLAPGASVRVHTGHGSNGAHNLYWGSSSYIWNNTGDKATLKNSAGTTLDTCGWSGSSGSISC